MTRTPIILFNLERENIMKKALVIGISLFISMCFVSPAVFADTEGDAVATATVEIIPNITIAQDPTGADMQEIQTGLFSGDFVFRIDSNMQYVTIGICASDLYKGGQTGGEVLPIPVADSEGVIVNPEFSNASTLAYNTDDPDVGGLAGSSFTQQEFESTQSGHFSADVDVTVTWDQDDAEKPQGDYSGYVKLFALIMI